MNEQEKVRKPKPIKIIIPKGKFKKHNKRGYNDTKLDHQDLEAAKLLLFREKSGIYGDHTFMQYTEVAKHFNIATHKLLNALKPPKQSQYEPL